MLSARQIANSSASRLQSLGRNTFEDDEPQPAYGATTSVPHQPARAVRASAATQRHGPLAPTPTPTPTPTPSVQARAPAPVGWNRGLMSREPWERLRDPTYSAGDTVYLSGRHRRGPTILPWPQEHDLAAPPELEGGSDGPDVLASSCRPTTPAGDRMSGDAARAFAFYRMHCDLSDAPGGGRSSEPLSASENFFLGQRVVNVTNHHMLFVCRAYADLPLAELTPAEWDDPPPCALTLATLFATPDEGADKGDLIVNPIAVRPTPTSLHVFALTDFLKWWIVRGTNPLTRGPCREEHLMRLDVAHRPKMPVSAPKATCAGRP